MHFRASIWAGTVRRVGDDYGLNAAVVEVLRAERARAGITLGELANRSEVPLVSVQRMLAGTRDLRLSTLEALCAGLQVSPAEVLVRAETRQRRRLSR